MASLVKLLCLLVCVGTLQAVNGLSEEEYKRALEALGILKEADEERRGVLDCKALGEDCNGVVRCCGSTQCYWEDGYSAIKDGECVKCVKKAKKCQRDSQCCSDLQCNKGNALWMDGTCEKYRRSGPCYRDGQCVNDCVKRWYKTSGECS